MAKVVDVGSSLFTYWYLMDITTKIATSANIRAEYNRKLWYCNKYMQKQVVKVLQRNFLTDFSKRSIACMMTMMRFPIPVVNNHPAIMTVLMLAGACEYANSKPGTENRIIPMSRIKPGGKIQSM